MKKFTPILIFLFAVLFNAVAQMNGGLGSMDEANNSPFLKGTGTLADPWTQSDWGTPKVIVNFQPGFHLVYFDGQAFKAGDYVEYNSAGTFIPSGIYELYEIVPGYLGFVGVDYDNSHLGSYYPYFKLPVGTGSGLLFGLAFLYGGVRIWRRKKKKAQE